jgi:hypothetical protein
MGAEKDPPDKCRRTGCYGHRQKRVDADLGKLSSMAKSTPPIGVLKVAAIPAPAPPAISTIRCAGSIGMSWPNVDPKEEPINRPLAAHRSATTDCQCRGQGLYQSHDRSDLTLAIIDRLHDFRNTVPFGLWREIYN